MRVAIIGGSGKMGRWFAHFLLKEGNEVIITGRNERKLLEAKQQLGVDIVPNVEAVERADVVLISVPIDNFKAVIEQLCPYIRPKQVIIDVTSIKVFSVETMHKHIKTGLVLGVHPMFGPSTKDIVGQNFVLTPTNREEQALAQKIREYLEARGARITVMTPQEHDEMMTVILGLSHFIAIVSTDTLSRIDKVRQMRAISGTTYKALLTLVESVIPEDPEFYASLQMSLPNMTEIEELFQKSAKTWSELIQNKDQQEFVKRMNILKNSFQKDNPDFWKASEKV
ncbi:MAG TPA: prephenate dehydrogenase [Dehalococcoidia bacterium]|nr:prephenate dehydrogenase [Dehalococcoidia bacterium]